MLPLPPSTLSPYTQVPPTRPESLDLLRASLLDAGIGLPAPKRTPSAQALALAAQPSLLVMPAREAQRAGLVARVRAGGRRLWVRTGFTTHQLKLGVQVRGLALLGWLGGMEQFDGHDCALALMSALAPAPSPIDGQSASPLPLLQLVTAYTILMVLVSITPVNNALVGARLAASRAVHSNFYEALSEPSILPHLPDV